MIKNNMKQAIKQKLRILFEKPADHEQNRQQVEALFDLMEPFLKERLVDPEVFPGRVGTDRKSSILGVWAAPGGKETFQKGGGLRSPPF